MRMSEIAGPNLPVSKYHEATIYGFLHAIMCEFENQINDDIIVDHLLTRCWCPLHNCSDSNCAYRSC